MFVIEGEHFSFISVQRGVIVWEKENTARVSRDSSVASKRKDSAVSRRTTEIGVRLALRATAGVVIAHIVRETCAWSAPARWPAGA